MKSTVETLSPTRVKLAIEVPFVELKTSLDAAYKSIGSQVRVPGFRPGKVPSRVIDQRVGRAAVLEEAINQALPKAYSEAVRETGVKALGQPDIEVTNFEDNTSLTFTAEVDIRPEITVAAYEGLAVTVDDVAVTDEDIAEQFESLRTRFGTLSGVDRPVESGDFVSLDLKAVVDGVEVEGGSATGLSYEVGSGDLVDGIDEAILGLSAGGEATFASKITYGDHAGSEAEITAVVNSVKVRELPDADDDFAQLASEFDTIDELRADLKERLGRVKVLEQGSQARDRLLELLIESTDVPVPESSVKAEIEWREHDVVHSLGHDDAAFERFLETEGKTKDEFLAELRETAEQSVKTQFILDSIADAQGVSVSDAELTNYIVSQSRRYGMPPQEFADQVVKGGNIGALVADVRRNKALATVMEAAAVTDVSGNPVDLSALNTADPDLGMDVLGDDDDDFDHDLDPEVAAVSEGDLELDTQDAGSPVADALDASEAASNDAPVHEPAAGESASSALGDGASK